MDFTGVDRCGGVANAAILKVSDKGRCNTTPRIVSRTQTASFLHFSDDVSLHIKWREEAGNGTAYATIIDATMRSVQYL